MQLRIQNVILNGIELATLSVVKNEESWVEKNKTHKILRYTQNDKCDYITNDT